MGRSCSSPRAMILVTFSVLGCSFSCNRKPSIRTLDAGSDSVEQVHGSDSGPDAAEVLDGPPISLGPNGIVVDQPVQGASTMGSSIAVTGWLDLARWASVLVIGASVDGYYALPSGHLGVPTVPVLLRSDGRFIAPRVPLRDGAVTIEVVPLPATAARAPKETLEVSLTASRTDIEPATITSMPRSGTTPLPVTLQVSSPLSTGTDWEWDFDGKGLFDTKPCGATATYTFDTPGVHAVSARTRDPSGTWIYAVTSVAASEPSQILDQAVATDPQALAVVTDFVAWQSGLTNDGLIATTDDTALTTAVLMIDGDAVQVFDAHLHLKQALSGFSHPRGVA